MIVIIDYGMGNLGSVFNMFKKIGVESKVSSNISDIQNASKILLPGVGSFDTAMKQIEDRGLRQVLDNKALIEKVPVLGICLGMQLLTCSSEEGTLPGLSWIKGRTLSFRNRINSNLKVPHMGWNNVKFEKESFILDGYKGDVKYYFVHSYFVKVEKKENSLMTSNYGLEFDSAIINDNIIGAQFHPEKSHKFGMKLFENFAKIDA